MLSDFWAQGHFFFSTPEIKELGTIKEKWTEVKKNFFLGWAGSLGALTEWTHQSLETSFNELAAKSGLKKGDVLLPLRIMLVGGKYGPGVFAIAELIGREETAARIKSVVSAL